MVEAAIVGVIVVVVAEGFHLIVVAAGKITNEFDFYRLNSISPQRWILVIASGSQPRDAIIKILMGGLHPQKRIRHFV